MSPRAPSRIEWVVLDREDAVLGRVMGADRGAALASARHRWGGQALRVQSLASWQLSEDQRVVLARDRIIRAL